MNLSTLTAEKRGTEPVSVVVEKGSDSACADVCTQTVGDIEYCSVCLRPGLLDSVPHYIGVKAWEVNTHRFINTSVGSLREKLEGIIGEPWRLTGLDSEEFVRGWNDLKRRGLIHWYYGGSLRKTIEKKISSLSKRID